MNQLESLMRSAIVNGEETHSQDTTDRSRYAKLNPNTIPMARVKMKDLENR